MSQIKILLVVAAIVPLGACAGPSVTMKARTVAAVQGMRHKAPAPLRRSLFNKPDDRETLSEEVIQRVINAPLEPELPARAGVVLLDAPFSRKSYTRLTPGDEAPQKLAAKLEQSKHFVMVSDISPHLVKGQDIESIRELATRYRLRYLVLLNRTFADRTRVNSWGWSWLTVLGIPFAPAYTFETAGLLEATLMDVRSGTFLFTTQVHVRASRRSTPWAEDRKQADLENDASRRATSLLARRFVAKCSRLLRYASEERAQRERREARRKEEGQTPSVAPAKSGETQAKQQRQQQGAGVTG